jgi:hypothetical protein
LCKAKERTASDQDLINYKKAVETARQALLDADLMRTPGPESFSVAMASNLESSNANNRNSTFSFRNSFRLTRKNKSTESLNSSHRLASTSSVLLSSVPDLSTYDTINWNYSTTKLITSLISPVTDVDVEDWAIHLHSSMIMHVLKLCKLIKFS